MLRYLFLATALATPVRADVADVVTTHILPGYAAFTDATAALSVASQGSCDAAALRPAYDAAFDAWLGVSHLRLGPVEDDGRMLAIAFWPDPKGLGKKALATLIAAKDPLVSDPEAFAKVSIAARGLFAMERLLYGDATGDHACAVTRAVAADLARTATETEAGWTDGFAEALTMAGTEGNMQFLSPLEARQAMFTQLIAGLEFNADQRLGRPLGTFDKPRPERAEARASARSLQNLRLSLIALRGLAVALVAESPQVQAAFDRAIGLAGKLDDPIFAGVADPQGWLKVQIVQQAVFATRDAVLAEIGPALGVGIGFNAGDGD